MSSENITVAKIRATRRLNDHGRKSDELIDLLEDDIRLLVERHNCSDLNVWVD
jgi:hypothetical protein